MSASAIKVIRGSAERRACNILGSERVEKHWATIEALRKVDLDLASRIYAAAVAEKIFQAFKKQGWKLLSERGCGCLLLSGRHNWRTVHNERCQIPGMDHTSCWKNPKGHRVLLTQPYGIYDGDLPELAAWAKKYDVRVHVDVEWSYYFPGRSIIIHLERRKDIRETWARERAEREAAKANGREVPQ